MRLSGLTLETVYFEDYLSFLSEVLELELIELSDDFMRLDLTSTWLEIVKVHNTPCRVASNLEFCLEVQDYQALAQKLSFFYYRKGPSRFVFLRGDKGRLDIADPDGRVWSFEPISSLSLGEFQEIPL